METSNLTERRLTRDKINQAELNMIVKGLRSVSRTNTWFYISLKRLILP